eukprot:m.17526 g.17526  ORF g.17526 m.17526 type:complete len:69 (+) comp5195_c0_seq1:174-380(+)
MHLRASLSRSCASPLHCCHVVGNVYVRSHDFKNNPTRATVPSCSAQCCVLLSGAFARGSCTDVSLSST